MMKELLVLALVASVATAMKMPAVLQSEEHPLQGFSCGADSTLGECLGDLNMALTNLRLFVIDHHRRSDTNVSNILKGLPRPLKCILKQHAHKHERAVNGKGDRRHNEEESSGDTAESQGAQTPNSGPQRNGRPGGRRGERPTGETEDRQGDRRGGGSDSTAEGENSTRESGEGHRRGGPRIGRPTDEPGEISRGEPRQAGPTQETGGETNADEGAGNENQGPGSRRGAPRGREHLTGDFDMAIDGPRRRPSTTEDPAEESSVEEGSVTEEQRRRGSPQRARPTEESVDEITSEEGADNENQARGGRRGVPRRGERPTKESDMAGDGPRCRQRPTQDTSEESSIEGGSVTEEQRRGGRNRPGHREQHTAETRGEGLRERPTRESDKARNGARRRPRPIEDPAEDSSVEEGSVTEVQRRGGRSRPGRRERPSGETELDGGRRGRRGGRRGPRRERPTGEAGSSEEGGRRRGPQFGFTRTGTTSAEEPTNADIAEGADSNPEDNGPQPAFLKWLFGGK
ncbi:sodium/potassium/calcium exchanger 1-like [Sycon ciliatum]|uniref:sodium/potassium/calcium exchanger 1-like n=1 Tax=Sycon ciliatum TaxID=27933 RepID=UPI0031F71155